MSTAGAALLAQQHSFQDVWRDEETSHWEMGCICKYMTIYTYMYTCVLLHGMVHVQTLDSSYFLHQRHLSFQVSITPCLSWLLYQCSQRHMCWRHWGEDSNFILQPKKKVILRDCKTQAHWAEGHHHSLGWSGSFLKRKRNKEKE